MFLTKYLNNIYYNLVIDNYSNSYINYLDEKNFEKIYNLLKKYDFYFIDDIILNYLEIFLKEEKYVLEALEKMKIILGDNFVNIIGNNIYLMDKVIDIIFELERSSIL
ncbi:MAG: hypothetical protein E7172_02465 [Firmicutes bacterium]|nr:hypothetical protein [Bacillota bacterium]